MNLCPICKSPLADVDNPYGSLSPACPNRLCTGYAQPLYPTSDNKKDLVSMTDSIEAEDYCLDGIFIRLDYIMLVVDDAMNRQPNEEDKKVYLQSQELRDWEEHIRSCDQCRRVEQSYGRWDDVNQKYIEVEENPQTPSG